MQVLAKTPSIKSFLCDLSASALKTVADPSFGGSAVSHTEARKLHQLKIPAAYGSELKSIQFFRFARGFEFALDRDTRI
jgi:hypothetical protein